MPWLNREGYTPPRGVGKEDSRMLKNTYSYKDMDRGLYLERERRSDWDRSLFQAKGEVNETMGIGGNYGCCLLAGMAWSLGNAGCISTLSGGLER